MQFCLESNDFSRIEIAFYSSLALALIFRKNGGLKLGEVPKKDDKFEILKLDVFCVNKKISVPELYRPLYRVLRFGWRKKNFQKFIVEINYKGCELLSVSPLVCV